MSKTIQTLSPEQSSKLVDWFDERIRHKIGGLHSCRNSLICLLLLDAGLRVGELVRLKVVHIWHVDAPALCLILEPYMTKTKTSRTIPLSERTKLAILKYSESRDHYIFQGADRYLFHTGYPNDHISTRQVERIIRTAGQDGLGIRVHPHMLRHTFATRLMQKTNIRVVQALLGHQSLQSTQIYTHPNDQDLKKAIDSME